MGESHKKTFWALELWQDLKFFWGVLDYLFFSCLLLLITLNNNKLVVCQIRKATLTPLGPSARLAFCSRSLFVTSPETQAEASLPAIDLHGVMMAERLPVPRSDLGATAGLRKAWIAIDFYLIQSFHLDSDLFPGAW